jgi:hypothetical protein
VAGLFPVFQGVQGVQITGKSGVWGGCLPRLLQDWCNLFGLCQFDDSESAPMQNQNRFRFSVASLGKLVPPVKGYVYYYDSVVPRLAARLSYSGRIAFVLTGSRGAREVIDTKNLEVAREYCRAKAQAGSSGAPVAVKSQKGTVCFSE